MYWFMVHTSKKSLGEEQIQCPAQPLCHCCRADEPLLPQSGIRHTGLAVGHTTHLLHPPHNRYDSLVSLCVVLVVLDAPWLEGVDKGHEGKGANNVLKQLVGAEAAVTGIVANHKELQQQ